MEPELGAGAELDEPDAPDDEEESVEGDGVEGGGVEDVDVDVDGESPFPDDDSDFADVFVADDLPRLSVL